MSINYHSNISDSLKTDLYPIQAPTTNLSTKENEPAQTPSFLEKVLQIAAHINAFGLKKLSDAPINAIERDKNERPTQQKDTEITTDTGDVRYVFKRDKRFGVEPGFEATKAWTKGDEEKLKDSNSNIYRQAKTFIKENISSSSFQVYWEKNINNNDFEQTTLAYNELSNNPGLRNKLTTINSPLRNALLKQDGGAEFRQIVNQNPQLLKQILTEDLKFKSDSSLLHSLIKDNPTLLDRLLDPVSDGKGKDKNFALKNQILKKHPELLDNISEKNPKLLIKILTDLQFQRRIFKATGFPAATSKEDVIQALINDPKQLDKVLNQNKKLRDEIIEKYPQLTNNIVEKHTSLLRNSDIISSILKNSQLAITAAQSYKTLTDIIVNKTSLADEILRTLGSISNNQAKSLEKQIKNYLISSYQKFTKLHYVKLDYSNPVDGKVKIPFYKAKVHAILGRLGKVFHQRGTAATPKEKNLGAVVEALANDLYTVLGFGGQKLKIIRATYSDGSPKLLLDGTHVTGPHGEKFSTLEGQIKSGRLEGNSVCVKEPGGSEKIYLLDDSPLGAAKIKALLFGDRDKIGSRGGNVGFVIVDGKARLMNIDPGKSLELIENAPPKRDQYHSYASFLFHRIIYSIKHVLTGKTDRMSQQNLHSDLSFDQPTATIADIASKGYKNYSIFDDTKLSEKMEGMHKILEEQPVLEEIFDNYIKAFSSGGDLNFKTELETIKTKFTERLNYFKSVLEERLKLDANELDLLDNFEKLTSKTTNHVKHNDQEIQFQHLQVIPNRRREWHMDKSTQNGPYTLRYEATNRKDAEQVQMQLAEFYSGADLVTVELIEETNQIEVMIDTKEKLINLFQGDFSEEKIAIYKNQLLRPVPKNNTVMMKV